MEKVKHDKSLEVGTRLFFEDEPESIYQVTFCRKMVPFFNEPKGFLLEVEKIGERELDYSYLENHEYVKFFDDLKSLQNYLNIEKTE